MTFRKNIPPDPERVRDLKRPVPPADIKHQCGRRIRDFRASLSRQTEPEIVFGLHNLCSVIIKIISMFPDPEQGGKRVAGHNAVFQNSIPALRARTLTYPDTLRLRALIRPENRPGQRRALSIHHHQSVHLP